MTRLLSAMLLSLIAGAAVAQDPFGVDARRIEGEDKLELSFTVPAKHYLYADQLEVRINSRKTVPIKPPAPKRKLDQFSEEEVDVYDHDFSILYALPDSRSHLIKVSYQGCSDEVCFLPSEKEFRFGQAAPAVSLPKVSAPDTGLLSGFTVLGATSGYVKEEPFLEFLDAAMSGKALGQDGLNGKGVLLTLFLILMGGLALNLTPCVLPMIPINIAIIGAGVGGGSRSRGLLLGASYGAGIALVYGLLGLAVVLTGSRFGALNASPWFNVGIAAIFVVMSLSMFGVFSLDFSNLQGKIKTGEKSRGSFLVSFFLGGIAALLAGACVAPVVISVLLLAADMHQKGNVAGLLLPFVLGLGMALPWPFAGAGISFLPKPGPWMEKIKYGFGVVILLGAGYYGLLGATLFQDRMQNRRFEVVSAQQERIKEGWHTDLESALDVARLSGKPVFIDFWASWCKNCLKMEKTTFQADAVKKRLDGFVKVKYRAEDLRSAKTREDLDAFGVVGLPTYVVLEASKNRQEKQ